LEKVQQVVTAASLWLLVVRCVLRSVTSLWHLSEGQFSFWGGRRNFYFYVNRMANRFFYHFQLWCLIVKVLQLIKAMNISNCKASSLVKQQAEMKISS